MDFIQLNNTDTSFNIDQPIHEQFEKQVQHTPHHIAAVDDKECITYDELNKKANCLAHYLLEKNIQPNSLIGIYLPHSIDAIICMLAVLKIRCGFIPIDIHYPQQRTTYMLSNVKTSLVLSKKNLVKKIDDNLSFIDIHSSQIKTYKTENPNLTAKNTDNIYLLYTSGTTGKPKGTLLKHLGINNLVTWYIKNCNVNSNDKILIISSLSFDLTYKNIFAALLTGAQLHLINLDYFDPEKINNRIEKSKITFINCTPSVFYSLIDASDPQKLMSLRHVSLGGEPIHAAKLVKFITACPKTAILNTYGPTECCDLACTYLLKNEDVFNYKDIPIGSVLANVKVLIINEKNEITNINESGELYIGGIGVSDGYINNPAENTKRFVENPAYTQFPQFGGKFYKTGDLVKLLPNGYIQYLGRIDEMIKLRGLRIEPNEIEKIISDITGIKQVIVVCHTISENNQRLDAFLVKPEKLIDIISLKKKLEAALPSYMIPNKFFQIEHIPLSPNGKVNKSLLHSTAQEIQTQKNENKARYYDEQALTEIWANVLNRTATDISIHDNFFDLGGYSLLATQVNIRIKRILGVNLPLESLFNFPTITDLAREINKYRFSQQSYFSTALLRLNLKKFQLSLSQKRIWFLSKLIRNNPFYNLPTAFNIKGDFNSAVLKKALNIMIKKHEILRTSFHEENGSPYQKVHHYHDSKILIKKINLKKYTLEKSTKIAQHKINNDANLSFDLENPPLIRAHLFYLTENESIFYLNIHHIIFDGWSWMLFKKELSELYNKIINKQKIKIDTTTIQYIDYAIAEEKNHTDLYLEQSKKYWMEHLKNTQEKFLPTDFSRRSHPTFSGKRITKILSETAYNNIESISRTNHITFFTSLVSVFILTLYRFSGNAEFMIATPVANRLDEKTESLLGPLINTAIFLSKANPELTLQEFLLQNETTITELLSHQHYPFETLIDNLNIERNISKNPLSQIMFSFQNHSVENFNFASTTIKPISIDTSYSRFDIEWQVWQEQDCLSLDIFYNTDIYLPSTIQLLLETFCNILENFPNQLNKKLAELYYSEQQNLAISYGKSTPLINKFVHNNIDKQCLLNPQKNALLFKDQVIDYKTLANHTNQIANLLVSLGANKGDRIAVISERNMDAVFLFLASLKLGVIFVPISLKNPNERINYIINQIKPALIFTEIQLDSTNEIININDIRKKACDFSTHFTTREINWDDPAYIMYTSGSTGDPKGVVVSHKNLTNVIHSVSNIISLNQNDTWLALTDFAFDIALLELFAPLCVGATIKLADKKLLENIDLLKNIINTNTITIIQATPSFWKILIAAELNQNDYLKIISGGEVLHSTLASELLKISKNVWNAYGPTETTIWSTLHKLSSNLTVSIGKPIENTDCFVVNENDIIIPVNQKGELCISGRGVALGYWNSQFKNKFCFITLPTGEKKHVYKTGDVVTLNSDGYLLFHGRNDSQVKIHGFRVELAEIEEKLMAHPAINQAAIVNKDKNNNEVISAFISVKDIVFSQQWEALFDSMYLSNNNGWINSYTHTLFPEVEMENWLNHCENLIKKQHPKNILEIGCGLGLLIERLAPLAKKYIALEMSQNAVNILKKKFTADNIIINKAYAHEAYQYIDSSTDTIIFNSVIQYFPSISYTEALLETIIDKLPKNSRIILADIRSLELAKLFYKSLFDYKNKPNNNETIQQAIHHDPELLFSPAYFVNLTKKNPFINYLEIQPKLGEYSNELNKYRYDVILHIKSTRTILLPDLEIDVAGKKFTLEEIENSLNQSNKIILFKNINNAHLLSNKNLLNTFYPHELLALANRNHLNIKFRLSHLETGAYDVVFYPISPAISSAFEPTIFQSLDFLTEILFHEPQKNELIIKNIKNDLSKKLPYYMLPTEWHILEKFPLNSNGKIDKAKLNKLSKLSKKDRNKVLSPSNTVNYNKKLLIKIWADNLNLHNDLEHFDENNNFFDLGGHSLLAVQLLSQTNDAFQVNVSLYEFYKNPTLLNHWNAIHSLLNIKNKKINSEKISLSKKDILFIIPPIDGSSGWYEPLINHLEHTFECVAFDQNIDITTEDISVEEIARDYLEKMKAIQPTGSYKIIGWSFGGLVAYEICNQLINLGHAVSQPILIDTPAPQNKMAIKTAYKNLTLLKQKERFLYYNSLAYINYKPKKYHLEKACLILADNTKHNNHQLLSEWQPLTMKTFTIQDSDHYSVIKQPHVSIVAEKIIQEVL